MYVKVNVIIVSQENEIMIELQKKNGAESKLAHVKNSSFLTF